MAFALNHMTVPGLDVRALVSLAGRLGCVGVEFRNDLQRELFDKAPASEIRSLAEGAGLRILALAEVKAFNNVTDEMLADARQLIQIAAECGAEAVSLIPRNDGVRLDATARQADLRLALTELAPLLDEHNLIGLIEPLGFEACALRHKEDVLEDIAATGTEDRFKLIHDTFHHHLAGGGPVFADQTAVVHVSGVISKLSPDQMQDSDRVLVDADDTLGNLKQLQQLKTAGFDGPISMEAFAPSIHNLSDPEAELSRSFNFIGQYLADRAA